MSKRTVLKGAGAVAGGAAFPYGVAGSALGSGYDGEMVVRTPGPANSLSPADVRDIQREKIAAFKSKTGADPNIGAVVPDEDAEVVALVYRIDAAGQPSTYIGAVPSDTPVPSGRTARLHRRARAHADSVRDGVDPKRADRDVDSGVVSAGYATGWDEMVSDYAIEYEDCPHGALYMGGEVYEKQGTSYYGYGVDHIHRANPGDSYCGSSWSLKEATCRHNWEAFDRDPPILHEYVPSTNKDGDYTVDASVGYSSASIGVSYNPPDVYRTVNAGMNGTENVVWDWDYSQNETTAAQHNPTSIIKSEEEATSGSWASNRLIEVVAKAEFYKVFNNYHNSDWSSYIHVE